MHDLPSLERDGFRFTVLTVASQCPAVVVTRIADGRRVDQIPVHDASDPPTLDPITLGTVAADWVARRVGAIPPEPVRCSGCADELVPVFDTDTDTQFEGALWISFSGGYGMFIDPVGEPAPRAVLCRVCAGDLCDTVGWVGDLLADTRSTAGAAPQ
jgi:hypothetical protein